MCGEQCSVYPRPPLSYLIVESCPPDPVDLTLDIDLVSVSTFPSTSKFVSTGCCGCWCSFCIPLCCCCPYWPPPDNILRLSMDMSIACCWFCCCCWWCRTADPPSVLSAPNFVLFFVCPCATEGLKGRPPAPLLSSCHELGDVGDRLISVLSLPQMVQLRVHYILMVGWLVMCVVDVMEWTGRVCVCVLNDNGLIFQQWVSSDQDTRVTMVLAMKGSSTQWLTQLTTTITGAHAGAVT